MPNTGPDIIELLNSARDSCERCASGLDMKRTILHIDKLLRMARAQAVRIPNRADQLVREFVNEINNIGVRNISRRQNFLRVYKKAQQYVSWRSLQTGRPRSVDRCKCGLMTKYRARKRGHKCKKGDLDQPDYL